MTITIKEIKEEAFCRKYTLVSCCFERGGIEYSNNLYVQGHGDSIEVRAGIDSMYDWKFDLESMLEGD